jgi:hypothetical protein
VGRKVGKRKRSIDEKDEESGGGRDVDRLDVEGKEGEGRKVRNDEREGNSS